MTRKPLPAAAGLAARLLAGAVLVYAGASKAASPAEEFAVIIGAYDLLPKDMALTAATVLPWAELLLGWALILGFEVRAAASAAGALFLSFALALLSTKVRGIQLPNCGCFGESIHFLPWQAALMDAGLLALCWTARSAAPSPFSLDSWSDRGYTPAHGR